MLFRAQLERIEIIFFSSPRITLLRSQFLHVFPRINFQVEIAGTYRTSFERLRDILRLALVQVTVARVVVVAMEMLLYIPFKKNHTHLIVSKILNIFVSLKNFLQCSFQFWKALRFKITTQFMQKTTLTHDCNDVTRTDDVHRLPILVAVLLRLYCSVLVAVLTMMALMMMISASYFVGHFHRRLMHANRAFGSVANG